MANENKITFGDLRFMFDGQTRLYLNCRVYNKYNDCIKHCEPLEITNAYKLWGTTEFCAIPISPCDIKAVGKNKIEITSMMPEIIFKAWCDYAKKED